MEEQNYTGYARGGGANYTWYTRGGEAKLLDTPEVVQQNYTEYNTLEVAEQNYTWYTRGGGAKPHLIHQRWWSKTRLDTLEVVNT